MENTNIMNAAITSSNSESEKFICPHQGCHRVFQKRWSLTRHFRKHTGEKPFRCSICSKEFVEKCGLVRHEQTHAQERHWECDAPGCKKKFKLKEYLDIHKKTWHAKNDLSNNNDLTLRSLSEAPGNNDTTDQLRQRLVRMSLRHREVVYSQQQREADLLYKLKTCSHFLQQSLNLINYYDSPDKKLFKLQVVQFLNESIALGSEDTESSSDSHDEIPPPDFLPQENPMNNLLNQTDHSISEYLAAANASRNNMIFPEVPNLQNYPLDLDANVNNGPSSSSPVHNNSAIGSSFISDSSPDQLQRRKRTQQDISIEPPAKFPNTSAELFSIPSDELNAPIISTSQYTAFKPVINATDPASFTASARPTTPNSVCSSLSSQSTSLYPKYSYCVPTSMATISQSCSGQPACSPVVSGSDVFDIMFTLTSEVNPTSIANVLPQLPALHPPPLPPHHSVHSSNPLSNSITSSLSSSSSSSLLSPSTTFTSPHGQLNLTSSSPLAAVVGGGATVAAATTTTSASTAEDQQSTNIADVMAWIKNNPLKTTKRYN